jgi:hypothetical protein
MKHVRVLYVKFVVETSASSLARYRDTNCSDLAASHSGSKSLKACAAPGPRPYFQTLPGSSELGNLQQAGPGHVTFLPLPQL